MKKLDYYRTLADVFDYPGANYPEKVRNAMAVLDRNFPGASLELKRFYQLLPVGNLKMTQELYIRTFDVQAITTLDLGYVLFGDDYKRGELLSNLNREHREHGNDCGSELADHLPNVLRLLPLLEDEELLVDLVQEILAPALSDMVGEFSRERIEKKDKAYEKHYRTLIELPSAHMEAVTLYQFALKALYQLLKQDFSIVERIPLKETSGFLGSLASENEIEDKASAFY